MEFAYDDDKLIETNHEEFIHHAEFDFYGERFATCSSDLTIKIFEKNQNEEWITTSVIKSHEASVWKVIWADPCFGSIIASCSLDKTIKIFEEKEMSFTREGIQKKWMFAYTYPFKDCVDIEFSPKQVGLKIAAVSHSENIGNLIVIEPDHKSVIQQCELKAQIKVSDYG